ncbi:hypothetical protein SNOG_03749 [Parastagonospora nodorum SN15]|uniref:Uncharacterized protein n=1 Tax=Phaeosphaeria nodorum (strain SN15 / ATCC MYA-4574 / FGSC 10173) TaxID=321614 RepID=Q0UWW5_PHANO|nr:hypothetical protein SNOG_03749 [Parastagonospora nodorum SN15]EAT88954.2 hypothetical protein SNOG_03749 [Parastagonospora nodorum SN15]
MAVTIDSTPATLLPIPKTHLLKGLKRHASAPARPPMTVDLSKITSQLRVDRDEWRTTAQLQEQQIAYHEQELEHQRHAFALLEEQHAAVGAERKEIILANDNLFTLFREAVNKHDKLADDLNESKRATARLKKSDRAKGKVLQRNLRLKSTLQRIGMQASCSPAAPNANTEASLLEALAAAAERIDELESKGEALLEALETRDDSSENEEEDDGNAKLLEAAVAIRGVLDEESFAEQKQHWEILLAE